jgi:hypothetical protein
VKEKVDSVKFTAVKPSLVWEIELNPFLTVQNFTLYPDLTLRYLLLLVYHHLS